MIKHIPNTLTLLNLATGALGIIVVLDGEPIYGAYFVLISAFFDFLDGFAARLLKVQGELGKQLDSLADMVSFGLLPGMVIYTLAVDTEWAKYFGLLIPMFSAYRLAKFNLDPRQSDRFIGLPTPANALLVTTLPFLSETWPLLAGWLESPFFIAGLSIILSILLVAEIPLIALKFKNFSLKDNVYRYLLIGLGIGLAVWLGLAGIPIIILAYFCLSIVENRTSVK